MADSKLMHGTSGVYQTEYAGSKITVRIFEAPELEVKGVVYMAMVSYVDLTTGAQRYELDQLTPEQKVHCRAYAAEQVPDYGELFKASMAMAYWRLIQ